MYASIRTSIKDNYHFPTIAKTNCFKAHHKQTQIPDDPMIAREYKVNIYLVCRFDNRSHEHELSSFFLINYLHKAKVTIKQKNTQTKLDIFCFATKKK